MLADEKSRARDQWAAHRVGVYRHHPPHRRQARARLRHIGFGFGFPCPSASTARDAWISAPLAYAVLGLLHRSLPLGPGGHPPRSTPNNTHPFRDWTRLITSRAIAICRPPIRPSWADRRTPPQVRNGCEHQHWTADNGSCDGVYAQTFAVSPDHHRLDLLTLLTFEFAV